MADAQMIATITAGGRVDGALREAIGTDVKALAQIGGVTLIERAITAARESGAERIVVIGGDEVRERCAPLGVEIVAERREGRDNVRRAIEIAGEAPLLLMTSDLPYIDTRSLRRFLDAASGLDIGLPLAEEADYHARFPQAPEHVVEIGQSRVANGSVVYFGPGVAARTIVVAQKLFDARKSLFAMARLLGPALLVRFVLRSLRIEHIEARAQAVLGVHARGVRNMAPELCFDVDSLEDYTYAAAHER